MGEMLAALAAAGARTLTTLAELVLPADCAGCHGPPGRSGLCAGCAEVLAEPPVPARPTPVPAGLPACVTGGEYGGVRRELILAYKERGRRGLAVPLGDALAAVVRAGWPVAGPGPLVLVPVPATAAAIRSRYGDHMLALASRAADRLRRDGLAVWVSQPVRALPKDDSTHLDRHGRAEAARQAFALRPAWSTGSGPAPPTGPDDLIGPTVAQSTIWRALGRFPRAGRPEAVWAADAGAVVLLDDVLTTGSTLAAVAVRLLGSGVPVAFAATLAASRLRGGYGRAHPRPGSFVGGDGTAWTV
jgi:predicted amidophosphoribosyltransferase